MTPTPTTETCTICTKDIRQPRRLVVDHQLAECCVCSCHEDHATPILGYKQFVARARREGLTGSGTGFGVGVCGQ